MQIGEGYAVTPAGDGLSSPVAIVLVVLAIVPAAIGLLAFAVPVYKGYRMRIAGAKAMHRTPASGVVPRTS